MQTKVGKSPDGLTATEWQAWFRVKVLRACTAAAAANFKCGVNVWWTAAVQDEYTALQRRLRWDKRKRGPLFLVGKDQDKRHSMNDMAAWRETGILVDRTTYAAGAHNSIRFDRAVQELPTASRVPDCIQSPVEMVIGLCKHDFHDSLPDKEAVNTWDIALLFINAVEERVTPELCRKCFDHAWHAICCFAGAVGTEIKVQRGTRNITVKCVRGGWVPRLLRG